MKKRIARSGFGITQVRSEVSPQGASDRLPSSEPTRPSPSDLSEQEASEALLRAGRESTEGTQALACSESSEPPYPEAPRLLPPDQARRCTCGQPNVTGLCCYQRGECPRETRGGNLLTGQLAGSDPTGAACPQATVPPALNAGQGSRSERPYPEAPLASRKAPDPKSPRRWIDPEVMRAFHAGDQWCICCGHYRVSAHHLVPRSMGGDDVLENLLPLCHADHMALHDGHTHHAYGVTHTPPRVRERIGRFLTSEAGSDHLRYVKAKLGTRAGAFLERYGVEL